MIVSESDERHIDRVGHVLEYGVLLWQDRGTPGVATRFYGIREAEVSEVLRWAEETGQEYAVGAFVGMSRRDPDPLWVWLHGRDPHEGPAVELTARVTRPQPSS